MPYSLDLSPLALNLINREDWMNVGVWHLHAGVELPKQKKGYYSFFEIFPPRDVRPDFRPLARSVGGDIRSLEVWWDGEIARIIYGCVDPTALHPFESAYEGMDVRELDRGEPEWVGELEEAPLFFDVEQLHGLAFTRFVEKHRGELLNHLIGSLSSDCVAWIQIVSMNYDWSEYAENFSMAMQSTVEEIGEGYIGLTPAITGGRYPLPTARAERKQYNADVRGSTIAVHGKKIAREAFEKGQLAGAIFHVRGLVSGSAEALDLLNSGITAGIKCSYDFVSLMPYSNVRLLRWMRKRACPIPDRFLSNLATGSFLSEWTIGYEDGKRTLIPVLCATPNEFAVFNCLPTDRDLPVRYCEPRPPRPVKERERRGAKV